MIDESVVVLEVNGVSCAAHATFVWNPDISVDTVTMYLPGNVVWTIDFEFLLFGGDIGGDIAVQTDDDWDTVVLGLSSPDGTAVVTFAKESVEAFVQACIDETEYYDYNLPAMRTAEVDYAIERILA